MIERSATDVGAVAHHDARRDAALHHRRAQCAGVEVDEALVHDGGAGRQVGAQPHPVGVGDAHPGGQHVVDHPRELVDAVDGHRSLAAQPRAHRLETLDRAGSVISPHHIGQHPEQAAGVQPVRRHQAVRQQMQSQVGVVGVGGHLVQASR